MKIANSFYFWSINCLIAAALGEVEVLPEALVTSRVADYTHRLFLAAIIAQWPAGCGLMFL